MSFMLGMSIMDDVIKNIRTSLVEKWLRNGCNGQVVIKKYRLCAAGCINIYYN